MIRHITNDNYKKLIEKNGVLVIKFYADWCGPCKVYGPIFEGVADNYSKARLVECDIDNAKRVAATFGIRSIPSTVILKDGKVVAQKMGGMQIEGLKNWLEENIS